MLDMNDVKVFLENAGPLGYRSYKPKYGDSKEKPIFNNIKLLSWPPNGVGVLAKKVMKHYGLGSDGKRQAICPRTYGIRHICSICDFIDAAVKGSDTSLIKRAQGLGPSERFLQLVIDWDKEMLRQEGKIDEARSIEIYDCPSRVHRDIMQTMATTKTDFTETEKASPLAQLQCYGQGIGKPKSVTFKLCMDGLAAKMVKVELEEWLPSLPDLEDAVKPLSPEKLTALLEGEDDSSAEPEPKKEEAKEDSIDMGSEKDRDPNWGASKEEVKQEAKPEPKKEEAKAPAEVAKPAPANPSAPKSSLKDLIAKAAATKTAATN